MAIVLYQCDTKDNNENCFRYWEKVTDNYINHDLVPYTRDKKTPEKLLSAFVECYRKFCIFAKVTAGMFNYMNRYYLKNQ